MNAPLYFQQLLHGLCEWVMSFGIAFWLAECWTREPAPAVVRLVRPPRFWLALLFGFGPLILSALLRGAVIKLYTTESLAFARLPVGYALSIIYGVLLGFAVVCAVAPATSGRPLRTGLAVGASAAMIVASSILGVLLWRQPWFHVPGQLVLTIAILAMARACGPGDGAVEVENAPGRTPRNLGLALTVGFLPSVLVLAAIGVAAATNLGKQASDELLWLCSIVSVVCCFGASIALFTRKTGGAIAGGVLLMLLNAFIAFFFGCCASVNFGSMH